MGQEALSWQQALKDLSNGDLQKIDGQVQMNLFSTLIQHEQYSVLPDVYNTYYDLHESGHVPFERCLTLRLPSQWTPKNQSGLERTLTQMQVRNVKLVALSGSTFAPKAACEAADLLIRAGAQSLTVVGALAVPALLTSAFEHGDLRFITLHALAPDTEQLHWVEQQSFDTLALSLRSCRQLEQLTIHHSGLFKNGLHAAAQCPLLTTVSVSGDLKVLRDFEATVLAPLKGLLALTTLDLSGIHLQSCTLADHLLAHSRLLMFAENCPRLLHVLGALFVSKQPAAEDIEQFLQGNGSAIALTVELVARIVGGPNFRLETLQHGQFLAPAVWHAFFGGLAQNRSLRNLDVYAALIHVPVLAELRRTLGMNACLHNILLPTDAGHFYMLGTNGAYLPLTFTGDKTTLQSLYLRDDPQGLAQSNRTELSGPATDLVGMETTLAELEQEIQRRMSGLPAAPTTMNATLTSTTATTTAMATRTQTTAVTTMRMDWTPALEAHSMLTIGAPGERPDVTFQMRGPSRKETPLPCSHKATIQQLFDALRKEWHIADNDGITFVPGGKLSYSEHGLRASPFDVSQNAVYTVGQWLNDVPSLRKHAYINVVVSPFQH